MKCPKCWAKQADDNIKLNQKVENAYGKIPKDEFLLLVEESRAGIDLERHSFVEKFEIGMEKGGRFTVGYKGQCTSCGWFFEYNEEQQAKIYPHI